ncbi:MAG: DUF4214 domain-containing protein [Lachnospiraceae bacterium]|nr:DUF4214 domain-containing protein [Lachnospiraceae bacterium]
MRDPRPKRISLLLPLTLFAAAFLLLQPAFCLHVSAQMRDTQVDAFVCRMYRYVLGREPDAEGRAYWTDRLLSYEGDGANLAYGFFRSREFQAREITNDGYLRILYRTFFDREPDREGYDHWSYRLDFGMSRNLVLCSFVNSDEFTALCGTYGITRGYMYQDGEPLSSQVSPFIKRLYENVLGRTPDTEGIQYWTEQIATGALTPEKVSLEFFHSPEFLGAGLQDPDFVDVLYRTFLSREPDRDGKLYWMSILAEGRSRDDVIRGFSGSREFQRLLRHLNVDPQSHIPQTTETDAEESERSRLYYKIFSAYGVTKDKYLFTYDQIEMSVAAAIKDYMDPGLLNRQVYISLAMCGGISFEDTVYLFTHPGVREKPFRDIGNYYVPVELKRYTKDQLFASGYGPTFRYMYDNKVLDRRIYEGETMWMVRFFDPYGIIEEDHSYLDVYQASGRHGTYYDMCEFFRPYPNADLTSHMVFVTDARLRQLLPFWENSGYLGYYDSYDVIYDGYWTP